MSHLTGFQWTDEKGQTWRVTGPVGWSADYVVCELVDPEAEDGRGTFIYRPAAVIARRKQIDEEDAGKVTTR